MTKPKPDWTEESSVAEAEHADVTQVATIAATPAELRTVRHALLNLVEYPFSPGPGFAPGMRATAEALLDELLASVKALEADSAYRGSLAQVERLAADHVLVGLSAESFLVTILALSYVSQKLDEWEFSTLMHVRREEVVDLAVRLIRDVSWG